MSFILDDEVLIVGEPIATSTPVSPLPSLCITANGWEEGRIERMENEFSALQKELQQMKEQLAVEKSTNSQLKAVIAQLNEEMRQGKETEKELRKELIVVEVRGLRRLDEEKGKVKDLKMESDRLLQDLVSARRYLPIMRETLDHRFYPNPEDVQQEIMLCHLERQNVVETSIDIDVDGYALMTVLLQNGSEYIRCEMKASNGVCYTFRQPSPQHQWKGDHFGHPLGFGALTIINRGKTMSLPESFTDVVKDSRHLISHVNLINLCNVGPLTRALRHAQVEINNM